MNPSNRKEIAPRSGAAAAPRGQYIPNKKDNNTRSHIGTGYFNLFCIYLVLPGGRPCFA